MTDWDIRGKRVVVTGATNGIGLAACVELAKMGANLALVARSDQRARAAVARIGGDVDVLYADLAEQASVRKLAEEILQRYPRLDVLVNNAGAMNSKRQVTPDGLELTWAANHLAPFLLTNLLLDRLRESAPSRIITTASDAHQSAKQGIPFDDLNAERGYGGLGLRRYGETKLANILFTSELAERLEGTEVTANCFHPGLVWTGFNKNNGLLMKWGMILTRPFARTPEQGADTLVWLVASPEVSDETGGYFVDRKRAVPSPRAQDMEAARKLWEVSERQTGMAMQGG
jgi:NAD(P)-dependent dehydrogenase (short-subunit alcohol dehydrogenase family)